MATDPSSNQTGLPLDPETVRRIEVYARAVGLTASDVVRKAFEEFEAAHNGNLAKGEETVFDVLNRAGLIGCLKSNTDTPEDLATNVEHMQGFGRD